MLEISNNSSSLFRSPKGDRQLHLEISNNSTSIFRSCQKKYYWHYLRGLQPLRKPVSLSIGGILHEAFDWLYKGTSHGDVLKFIETSADNQIAKAAPEDVEDFVIAKYTLLGLWQYMPWKYPLLDWAKVESEKEFRIPVPGTRQITLVGKIDGLVTDKQGAVWVRELKTTSQPFSLFEVRSKQSGQATAYTWAMRQLGIPVVGTYFEFCKKPLLRKGVNETADMYGQRIMADPGNRPDVYFKRHPSYRSDEELRLFEADMVKVAKEIRQRSHDNQWHRNTDQCWVYNSACPYMPICFQEKPDQLTIDQFFEHKLTNHKGAKNGDSRGINPGDTAGSA